MNIENNTIVDNAGRIVEIKPGKSFKRIISLYGAHGENLLFIGDRDRLIGVSKNGKSTFQERNKPVFSYHDDPEKFLGARPDLVLIRPMIDRGYPDLVKRLESSGITVLSLQPSSVEELYVYWKILGLLTDERDISTLMVARFKTAVMEFSKLTAGVDNKKKVYFESIHSRMKTFSPDSISMFILKTAGGINIASDAVPSRGTNIAFYGKEKILSMANDIDVFIAQKGVMNNPDVRTIREEPGFNIIKAVRDNKIYIIDETIVSRPSFRLLNGILGMGNILYPELFGERAQVIMNNAMKGVSH